MKLLFPCFLAVAAYFAYAWLPSWYQFTTSVKGISQLLELSQEDVDKGVEAYQFLMAGTAESNTDIETTHVRNYYKVISPLLSIADIEKMYIPPLLDAKKGLFGNQLILEKRIIESLNVVGADSRLLDIGCGRGRISHFATGITGGNISGFNIDESQIKNAQEYALKTGLANKLDFKVGDHHKKFQYEDEAFDGVYSFQALWPFFKTSELDSVSREIFRVLKPGGQYACSEYLLTPHFNHNDPHHVHLHALFLPTLAATQSNYPKDVTDALERAGFKVLLSAPSEAPAWPLTDEKTDIFLALRSAVVGLTRLGLLPPWVEVLINQLLRGGVAWADAEKAKLADLNWRITVQKPF